MTIASPLAVAAATWIALLSDAASAQRAAGRRRLRPRRLSELFPPSKSNRTSSSLSMSLSLSLPAAEPDLFDDGGADGERSDEVSGAGRATGKSGKSGGAARSSGSKSGRKGGVGYNPSDGLTTTHGIYGLAVPIAFFLGEDTITGSATADVGLLLVPAEKGGFEAAVAEADPLNGVEEGQTRQHARLLYLLGVEQIIVGVNSMIDVDWSERAFGEVKRGTQKMLKDIGFKPKKVPFIPYSGYDLDGSSHNLVEGSDEMPWFKGRSLEETLNNMFIIPLGSPSGDQVSLRISKIYNTKGVGQVLGTKVLEQGTVLPGDVIGIVPSGLKQSFDRGLYNSQLALVGSVSYGGSPQHGLGASAVSSAVLYVSGEMNDGPPLLQAPPPPQMKTAFGFVTNEEGKYYVRSKDGTYFLNQDSSPRMWADISMAEEDIQMIGFSKMLNADVEYFKGKGAFDTLAFDVEGVFFAGAVGVGLSAVVTNKYWEVSRLGFKWADWKIFGLSRCYHFPCWGWLHENG
ncbi:hypothetical protein ACHAWF_013985 [Thalassiosira exigua]